MKKLLLVCLMALGCLVSVMAQQPARYGYCPENLRPEDAVAQGTGKNKFVAALICLDPASDPVMQRLKGHQVKGVRCFLRDDYKQAGQKRSYVMLSQGAPGVDPVKKMHNFVQGWNDVYFDEPVVIGEEKLFVGFQVFEKAGSPYPLVTDGRVSVPGGAWINLDRKGWEELDERGTFMIQALLDDEAAAVLGHCAYAQIATHPLTLLPGKPFDATVYFKNISGAPVQSLALSTLGEGDEAPQVQTVSFEPALDPFDARVVPVTLTAGRQVANSAVIALSVSEVNGQPAAPAREGRSTLYVTEDAFLRIPLVEEFTSQLCPNCPFMMYYVEKAREAYEGPLLYVTHHTGFQDDAFTKKGEESLLYLFGEAESFNPAIMYDRLYFPSESKVILASTGETTHLPYLEKFNEVAQRPAMAEVLVDVDKSDTQLGCRVHGRVNREMAASDAPLYISVCLVEDGLTLDKYMQMGLDAEGAPEDLVSGFRHNGIVRHLFTQSFQGDVLTVADDATFSVDFPAVDWNADWKWENCQVVAFVHRVNEKDLADNFVLNAGSNKYNHLITGIADVSATAVPAVRFYVDGRGCVRTDVPVRQLQIFRMSGAKCSAATALTAGVYVVRAELPDGRVAVSKLLVK